MARDERAAFPTHRFRPACLKNDATTACRIERSDSFSLRFAEQRRSDGERRLCRAQGFVSSRVDVGNDGPGSDGHQRGVGGLEFPA